MRHYKHSGAFAQQMVEIVQEYFIDLTSRKILQMKSNKNSKSITSNHACYTSVVTLDSSILVVNHDPGHGCG